MSGLMIERLCIDQILSAGKLGIKKARQIAVLFKF